MPLPDKNPPEDMNTERQNIEQEEEASLVGVDGDEVTLLRIEHDSGIMTEVASLMDQLLIQVNLQVERTEESSLSSPSSSQSFGDSSYSPPSDLQSSQSDMETSGEETRKDLGKEVEGEGNVLEDAACLKSPSGEEALPSKETEDRQDESEKASPGKGHETSQEKEKVVSRDASPSFTWTKTQDVIFQEEEEKEYDRKRSKEVTEQDEEAAFLALPDEMVELEGIPVAEVATLEPSVEKEERNDGGKMGESSSSLTTEEQTDQKVEEEVVIGEEKREDKVEIAVKEGDMKETQTEIADECLILDESESSNAPSPSRLSVSVALDSRTEEERGRHVDESVTGSGQLSQIPWKTEADPSLGKRQRKGSSTAQDEEEMEEDDATTTSRVHHFSPTKELDQVLKLLLVEDEEDITNDEMGGGCLEESVKDSTEKARNGKDNSMTERESEGKEDPLLQDEIHSEDRKDLDVTLERDEGKKANAIEEEENHHPRRHHHQHHHHDDRRDALGGFSQSEKEKKIEEIGESSREEGDNPEKQETFKEYFSIRDTIHCDLPDDSASSSSNFVDSFKHRQDAKKSERHKLLHQKGEEEKKERSEEGRSQEERRLASGDAIQPEEDEKKKEEEEEEDTFSDPASRLEPEKDGDEDERDMEEDGDGDDDGEKKSSTSSYSRSRYDCLTLVEEGQGDILFIPNEGDVQAFKLRQEEERGSRMSSEDAGKLLPEEETLTTTSTLRTCTSSSLSSRQNLKKETRREKHDDDSEKENVLPKTTTSRLVTFSPSYDYSGFPTITQEVKTTNNKQVSQRILDEFFTPTTTTRDVLCGRERFEKGETPTDIEFLERLKERKERGNRSNGNGNEERSITGNYSTTSSSSRGGGVGEVHEEQDENDNHHRHTDSLLKRKRKWQENDEESDDEDDSSSSASTVEDSRSRKEIRIDYLDRMRPFRTPVGTGVRSPGLSSRIPFQPLHPYLHQ